MKELYCEKIYNGGEIFTKCYYKDSTKQELHREDGPAKIEYRSNGHINAEEYYKDGVRHREDGPAKLEYYYNVYMQDHLLCEEHHLYNILWPQYFHYNNILT